MKTLKQVEIEPVWFDESLPDNKDCELGKLYISRKYMGIKHKCLCGCGVDTFISLKSIDGVVSDRDNDIHGGWDLITDKNGRITLSPSLLQRFDCKSHYIITKNKANFV